jgi:hypothetical protein
MNAKRFFLSWVVILCAACINCSSVAQQSARRSDPDSSSLTGCQGKRLIPTLRRSRKHTSVNRLAYTPTNVSPRSTLRRTRYT